MKQLQTPMSGCVRVEALGYGETQAERIVRFFSPHGLGKCLENNAKARNGEWKAANPGELL